jgi:hypothetical protein
MHTLPVPDSASAPAIPPTRLSPSHETFCQALITGNSLSDAYRQAFPHAHSQQGVWASATRLRARQDVQDRLRELQALAAERTVIKGGQLIYELCEIASADPGELSQVATVACPNCWSDADLATAMDRAIAERTALPDPDSPQPGCAKCRSRGVQKVIIANTTDLSGPARRLYQGARQRPDGSIEVTMIDQLQARRELHDLLGMRVHRSESKNLNLNATIPTQDVTPDDVLRAFHAARESTP